MHRRSLVHWHDAFRRGRTIAQGAVGPDRVVVNPPLLNQDLGFLQGVEYLAVQELVPEARVEAFAVSVLPG